MENLHFTLNGRACEAPEGSTVLEAAARNGVEIPALCNDMRLGPFGSCMLCRVEIDGARGNPLACGQRLAEGMVIRTESGAIRLSRKTCLELLLSEHTGDCVAPCTMTCPAHVDARHYIEKIAEEDYSGAVRLVREQNPLPAVCGRICTRPCEDECRRNLVDERIAIDGLKRFASDYEATHGIILPEKAPATGKKVAVIGAGPAGLSCAYYLLLKGHAVTIFERRAKAGGMLRYGIPSYRLPRDILEREAGLIESLGAEIRYGIEFGKDVTPESLKEEGFSAIFLGVGSQKGWALGCAGEDACQENILTGVEFLGRVEQARDVDLTGKRIVVVGGGNTAIDAARTSVRLGASQVEIVYRRGKAEMPAHAEEIAAAEAEGVSLRVLTVPKAVRKDEHGAVLTLIRTELGEPDASGRCRPAEVEGSEYDLAADLVISAVGQTQDLSFLNEKFPLETVKGRLAADGATGKTALPGVYAGGDVVTGPATAIEAIAAGKRSALAIDAYLRGEEYRAPDAYFHVKGKTLREVDPAEYEEMEKLPKQHPAEIPPEERKRTFDEAELSFTEEEARKEAARCLKCGCDAQDDCLLRKYSAQYGADQFAFTGEKARLPRDDSHPYFFRDPSKCILCGRCMRICAEVKGAHIFGFKYRGSGTVTEPYLPMVTRGDDVCRDCMLCVDTCPTGELLKK